MKDSTKPLQRLHLNKSTIAQLDAQQLRKLWGGAEAEAEFTSIFACKSRKCTLEPILCTSLCTVEC